MFIKDTWTWVLWLNICGITSIGMTHKPAGVRMVGSGVYHGAVCMGSIAKHPGLGKCILGGNQGEYGILPPCFSSLKDNSSDLVTVKWQQVVALCANPISLLELFRTWKLIREAVILPDHSHIFFLSATNTTAVASKWVLENGVDSNFFAFLQIESVLSIKRCLAL